MSKKLVYKIFIAALMIILLGTGITYYIKYRNSFAYIRNISTNIFSGKIVKRSDISLDSQKLDLYDVDVRNNDGMVEVKGETSNRVTVAFRKEQVQGSLRSGDTYVFYTKFNREKNIYEVLDTRIYILDNFP